MRYGLIGSIVFHVVVFGLVIFNFAGGDKPDVAALPPPVAVDIMNPQDFSDRQQGKTDGKLEKPAIAAEKKAPDLSAVAKKEVEPKPAPKPAEKEALPPPPKAAEAQPTPQPPKPQETAKQEPPKPIERPKPVEKAEPTPEKPVEKQAVKPLPKKEPERKAVAHAKPEAAKKQPEPEAKRADQPKPQPERAFDPNRIASLIKKDEAAHDRPAPSASMMNAQPSKTISDRQSAVLNRDPNAGDSGGAYQPGQPWRPASSLEEQARGAQGAQGATNASSDADFLLSQISRNWDLPSGALGADTAIITLHFRLNPDGMLAGDPEITNRSYDPAFAAAADAAKRAVFRAQPFKIPPGRYDQFRDNTISFDPRAMYGAANG